LEEAATPPSPALPVPQAVRRRPAPAPAAQAPIRVDPALAPAVDGELAPDSIEVLDVRNVTYFDGQISVEFKKVPAGEALEEIGALAGFAVITDAAIGKKPLSVRFNDQPLEKGLTRIIRLIEAGNYRYYYNDEGRLETVVVTASSQSISEEPTRRPATANRTPARSGSPERPPTTRPPSTRRRQLRPAAR